MNRLWTVHLKTVFAALGFCTTLMLLLFSAPAPAQDLPDFVVPCDNCMQQADYALIAANRVPQAAYEITFTWSVYVVSVAQNRVEPFQVVVPAINGDNGGGGQQPRSVPGVCDVSYQFGPWPHKIVTPVNGDPLVKVAVLEGASIAANFVASLHEPLDGLQITRVDSAIDLVGPEDSPAGYARLQLRGDLMDKDYTRWKGFMYGAGDLIDRMAVRILGETRFDKQRILITFEDGTSIQVEVESIHAEANGLGVFIEYAILPHTARLPDGSRIPQNGGQFSNFSWSGSGDDGGIGARLALLAGLYGLEVGEPEDDLDCDFECNGDRCSLSCSF